MTEIGSFLELDLLDNSEYYSGEKNIARLNSGRASIYHALRLLNCNSIHIPYYQCPTVQSFLKSKGIEVIKYYLNDDLTPKINNISNNSSILIVNYFGIFSNVKLAEIASHFQNTIIDNCPGFFNKTTCGAYTVYSARKFFGVPDGAYLIGENAQFLVNQYELDYSSKTSSFLFKRIEYGSSEVYLERQENENRIDNSDIKQMSVLTHKLLKNIDYTKIKNRRLLNFRFAHEIYKNLNEFDPTIFIDNSSIPMVYPLLIRDIELVEKLKHNKIYTGRWWKHILQEVDHDTLEFYFSTYMVPIPIDQRYDESTITNVFNIVEKLVDVKNQ